MGGDDEWDDSDDDGGAVPVRWPFPRSTAVRRWVRPSSSEDDDNDDLEESGDESGSGGEGDVANPQGVSCQENGDAITTAAAAAAGVTTIGADEGAVETGDQTDAADPHEKKKSPQPQPLVIKGSPPRALPIFCGDKQGTLDCTNFMVSR
jgi:hypothetical protein